MSEFILPAEIVAKLDAAVPDPRELARRKKPMIDEAIRTYRPKGLSYNTLADALGVSASIIKKRAAELGVD